MKQEKRSFAVIRFNVSPQGVIYIDGEKKGVAPALKEIKVEKGVHTIVIKHEHFKTYRRVVRLTPHDIIQIEHSFRKRTATASKKNFTARKHVYKTAGKGGKATGKISSAAFTSNFTPQ